MPVNFEKGDDPVLLCNADHMNMVKYRHRPGIVMVRICGEYLLVPTREASEICPQIIRLRLMPAALWEEIGKGNGTDKICFFYEKLSKKSKEEVEQQIETILRELYEKGYLVKAGDEV